MKVELLLFRRSGSLVDGGHQSSIAIRYLENLGRHNDADEMIRRATAYPPMGVSSPSLYKKSQLSESSRVASPLCSKGLYRTPSWLLQHGSLKNMLKFYSILLHVDLSGFRGAL